MKKSTLTAGLRAAAGHSSAQPTTLPSVAARSAEGAKAATVLIGGHFSPEVRRALLLVQAEAENSGKGLKQLLGEAINDLCVKYGKPQPYQGDV